MLKELLNKYFGSTRLFFSLVAFIICIFVATASFFCLIELTSTQVTLLLGALGNAVAYITVETIRKS